MNDRYTLSTDKARLDVTRLHALLTEQAYWARNRSPETVRQSIEHSLCFGAYEGSELVGFARVVTDYAVIAWLLDVLVVEAHRGEGIGKALVEAVLVHPDLRNVRRWMLGTHDAHDLYRQYGFGELANPGLFMERIKRRSPVANERGVPTE
jgi:GNAT superfamily N-acetyltransferase